jgi:hypothetical protein
VHLLSFERNEHVVFANDNAISRTLASSDQKLLCPWFKSNMQRIASNGLYGVLEDPFHGVVVRWTFMRFTSRIKETTEDLFRTIGFSWRIMMPT